MSDGSGDEPWWADEAPVGTHRRANGRFGDDRPRGDVAPPGRAAGFDPDAPLPGRDAGFDPDVAPPGRAAGFDPDAPAPRRERPPPRDRRPGPDAPPRGTHDAAPPSRPRAQVFIPPPEELPPFEEVAGPPPRAVPPDAGEPPLPPATRPVGMDEPVVPPAPVLEPLRHARPAAPPSRPRAPAVDRRRLAVVYDVEGPRVRLGIAWFAGAMAATALSPYTCAAVFAVAAGLAARQIARAWGSVSWQADVAAGLGALPVVAALFGVPAVVGAAVVVLLVAAGAAGAPDGARLPGPGGRVAAAGILALSLVPALAGATMVLVRDRSVVAAAVLLLLAGAYEMGDFIVGSGASNPIEGPLAGMTTATLVSLPLALVLVEPYDAAGIALVAFTAAACPFSQVVASAALPGAGAPAPALRRIDTLLVLGLIWAAAAL